MPPTFHIASLNHYTPKISGLPLDVDLESLVCPEWGDADILTLKKEVLGFFFCKNQLSGQTVDYCLLHVIHIWKAMTLSYNLAYQEIILVHPTRRQIFAGKPYSTFWNIWDLFMYSIVHLIKMWKMLFEISTHSLCNAQFHQLHFLDAFILTDQWRTGCTAVCIDQAGNLSSKRPH